MEKLRTTIHLLDGETVVQDEYGEVDPIADVLALNRDVISFVTRTGQANNFDVLRTLAPGKGKLLGGTRFSTDGTRLNLSSGKRSASVEIFPETKTATTIKTTSTRS